MIAALLVASCMWVHPGADHYGGKLGVAIDRLAELTPHQRAQFKVLVERGDYSQIVTIKAGSPYRIRNMAFGGKGKVCGEVDTSHLQGEVQAMVFTFEGISIIRPSVCNNIAQIEIPAEPIVPPAAIVQAIPVVFEQPATDVLPDAPLTPAGGLLESPPAEAETSGGTFAPGGFYPVPVGGPCCAIVPTPTLSPVPEPEIVYTLLAGLAALISVMFRKRRP